MHLKHSRMTGRTTVNFQLVLYQYLSVFKIINIGGKIVTDKVECEVKSEVMGFYTQSRIFHYVQAVSSGLTEEPST